MLIYCECYVSLYTTVTMQALSGEGETVAVRCHATKDWPLFDCGTN